MESKSSGISCNFFSPINSKHQLKCASPKQKKVNDKRNKKKEVEIWSLFRKDLSEDYDLTTMFEFCASPKTRMQQDLYSPKSRLKKSLDAGRQTLALLKDAEIMFDQPSTSQNLIKSSPLNKNEFLNNKTFETPHIPIDSYCSKKQSEFNLLTDSPISCKVPLKSSTPLTPVEQLKRKTMRLSVKPNLQIDKGKTISWTPKSRTPRCVSKLTSSNYFNDSMDDPETNALLSEVCIKKSLTVEDAKEMEIDDDDIIFIQSPKETKKNSFTSQCETPKLNRYSTFTEKSQNLDVKCQTSFKRHRSLLEQFQKLSTEKQIQSINANNLAISNTEIKFVLNKEKNSKIYQCDSTTSNVLNKLEKRATYATSDDCNKENNFYINQISNKTFCNNKISTSSTNYSSESFWTKQLTPMFQNTTPLSNKFDKLDSNSNNIQNNFGIIQSCSKSETIIERSKSSNTIEKDILKNRKRCLKKNSTESLTEFDSFNMPKLAKRIDLCNISNNMALNNQKTNLNNVNNSTVSNITNNDGNLNGTSSNSLNLNDDDSFYNDDTEFIEVLQQV